MLWLPSALLSFLFIASNSLGIESEKLKTDEELETAIVEKVKSLNEAGKKALKEQNYIEAKNSFEKALRISTENLGTEHLDTLESMNNFAFIHIHLNECSKAVVLGEAVLEKSKKILGVEQPDTLRAMHNLAAAYAVMGDNNKAAALGEEALKLSKKTSGLEDFEILDFMDNLASIYAGRGDYSKAVELYKKELELTENLEAPDRSERKIVVMNNLAVSYTGLGEYFKALSMHEKTLELSKETFGLNSYNTLVSMINLASVYDEMGKGDKGAALLETALELSKKILDPDNPASLTVMNNLAMAYDDRGDHRQAAVLNEKILEKRKKILGPEDHDTLISMNNLASDYYILGDYAKAVEMFAATLEAYKKVLVPGHPDILTACNNLALSYSGLGDYEKAQKMFKEIMEEYQKKFGDEYPGFLTSKDNLASTYALSGDYRKALELFEANFAARKNKLGEHRSTFTSANNLAVVYFRLGKYVEAEKFFKEALNGRTSLLGPEHPDSLVSMIHLASTCFETGDSAKALAINRKNLSLFEQIFQTGHPDVVTLQSNLAMQLHRGNQPSLALFYARLSVDNVDIHRAGQKGLSQDLAKKLMGKHASVYEFLAERLLERGRIDEAITTLQWLKLDEARGNVENAPIQNGADKSQGTVLAELDPLIAEYQEINNLRREKYHKLRLLLEEGRIGNTPDHSGIDSLRAELAAQDGKLENFLKSLPAKVEKAMQIKPVEAFSTMGQFQEYLNSSGSDAAILHIFPAENSLWLILTTRDAPKPEAVRVECKKDELESNVRELFSKLEYKGEKSVKNTEDPRPFAGYFYDVTISKIAKKLPKPGATLVMYLYGSLRYIPPAVFYDSENKQWLVEQYPLVVFTNASRENMTAGRSPSWTVAGFAASRALNKHGSELAPLPNAISGLQAIIDDADGSCEVPHSPRSAEGFIPGSCFIDDGFTAQTFYSALGGKDYLVGHVSGHFTLNGLLPEQSILYLGNGESLVLSDFNKQAPLLSHIDLLIFSGCHTGPGLTDGPNDGKEIESLGEYGQRKGARSVMATLWDIRDDSSGSLITEFYRQSQKGLSKAEALRQAQLRFIKGGLGDKDGQDDDMPVPAKEKGAWTHPHHWAPFILMGNWL